MQPFKPDLPAGWTALHLPETDSTMSALRRQPASDAPFELLTADFQTAGHGQRGTVWESERGQNLLFSFRFHPHFLPAARQFALSEALSLAMVRALRPLGVEATVKWPNDIYVGQRKLCGMLLEHTLAGNAIATTLTGVGVNVNQTDFQGDAPNPVSLRQLLGRSTDRAALLGEILRHFEALYRDLSLGCADQVHADYLHHLFRREGLHPYRDAQGPFMASIADITPQGLLVLQRPDGSRRAYAFKEVCFQLGIRNEELGMRNEE